MSRCCRWVVASPAPPQPDNGQMIVYPCNDNPNEQFIFTSFEPIGLPTPDQPKT
jgi:hypothetical protein